MRDLEPIAVLAALALLTALAPVDASTPASVEDDAHLVAAAPRFDPGSASGPGGHQGPAEAQCEVAVPDGSTVTCSDSFDVTTSVEFDVNLFFNATAGPLEEAHKEFKWYDPFGDLVYHLDCDQILRVAYCTVPADRGWTWSGTQTMVATFTVPDPIQGTVAQCPLSSPCDGYAAIQIEPA